MSSVVTRRHTPPCASFALPPAASLTHRPHSFSSSMEVKVSAYRQSLTDPVMSSLACQALLTMVAGTLCPSLSSVARVAPLQVQIDFTPTRLQYPPSAQSYLCQLLPLPTPSSSATTMRPASAAPTACKRVCSSLSQPLNHSNPVHPQAHTLILLLLMPLPRVGHSWHAAART
jgi:hypothetical protein